MPLDGLRWSRDSGSALYNMPQIDVFGRAGGSIVTKSIPEGQVWAGVPAHFICTIEEYREKMLKQRKDINWKDKERELKRVFEII